MPLQPDFALALAVLAALGSGLIGGLFLAFSTSVMKALQRLPPQQGMAAMRHINRVILNPLFLGIFLGTALLCGVLAVQGFASAGSGSRWLLAGAAAYLLGTFGVTMAFNVPLNNRLDSADPSAPGAAGAWQAYVVPWVRWNHLRTLMSAAAALAFTLAAASSAA